MRAARAQTTADPQKGKFDVLIFLRCTEEAVVVTLRILVVLVEYTAYALGLLLGQVPVHNQKQPGVLPGYPRVYQKMYF